MKFSVNLKTVLTVFLLALALPVILKSQDLTPPKPVESAYFDKWVGTWIGENAYGGQPGKQTVICKWDLNHQFLTINVTGTFDDKPGEVYNGSGYYSIDQGGNVIGYWFDIFGPAAVTVSKGKINGDKMENNVTADGYTGIETADFTSQNEVKLYSKGTWDMNGQKFPMESTTFYKRK